MTPGPGRVSFHFLAEHYLKADFGADAVRPKSVNTSSHVEHVVRAYLVPRFGDEIAEDIKPLDIQRWLKSLHVDKDLAWPTISKIRDTMRRVYKIGMVHGHVPKNPLMHVETRSKSDQGHRHHACSDACDPSFPTFTSSLHVGAHVLSYGAPCFRDAVAPLGRRAVGGGADTDLQALGKG